MAEIVLTQIGGVAGKALLPNGLSLLGANLSGAAIGQAVGRLVGRAIDASLIAPLEGPRVKSLSVMESREGAGLPTLYGRMRVGGQVIWAARFKERRRERSAGKGGPKYADYSYSVSFAVALCQGPITRVDRIWANGELLTLSGVNWRIYSGDEQQLPDPLIEAIEGAGQAPAYRGTAYIVFEDFPLDAYGNRLPQLSFEVIRAGRDQALSLGATVRGVNIIPASGEFVYATSIVRERRFPGIERALNMNNTQGDADFSVSVAQLKSDLPRVNAAALTVAWFGTDLRAGACRVRPGVETRERDTVPFGWEVDGTGRGSAHLISTTGGSANYGGTPADRAVIEGIQLLKQSGVSVTLSPFLLMDVPPNNGLPDPYGSAEQAAFPWRGRLTVSADRTAAARQEIDAFVGQDGGFGFRHFILHHARLAQRAGGVDAFLIGSEMVGLTRIRDNEGRFPFVEALISLATEVKAIVGAQTSVSYAADWTEYGAYVPQDGSGDVLFPLDPLWSASAIDFVGIDWYPPMGDWRDGADHLDAVAGFTAPDDPLYLAANLEGGEGHDWYYADDAARDQQIRTPINDGAYGEDWLFRPKAIRAWWQNQHYSRIAGVRNGQATEWVGASKPIRLIEIGFPAIDKGGNAPSLFFDPKSSESQVPPYSNGNRDDLLQRNALAVSLTFWDQQPMIEQSLVWAWDGRPWPDYPAREAVWTDGPNWQFGHWLNGRSGLIDLSEIVSDLAGQAKIDIDTRHLNGVVEGYGFDGFATLASVLAPLQTAYDFRITEQTVDLKASQVQVQPGLQINETRMLETSERSTWPLLDKRPSAVSITYVSASGNYEPAVVEAFDEAGQKDFKLSMSLPIVMGEGRATLIAETQLRSIGQQRTRSFAIGPEALFLEVADVVTLNSDERWVIDRIVDDGLRRTIAVSPASGGAEPYRAMQVPAETELPAISAEPFMVLIDGPRLSPETPDGVLVGLTGQPWAQSAVVEMGASPESLKQVARFDAPSPIGQLEQRIGVAPLGRWDRLNALEVFIPGAELASRDAESVLGGANRLLLQHDAGWELIGWQSAELIGEDRWRLESLLRGLRGSPIGAPNAGSLVVVADDTLQSVVMDPDLIGVPHLWRAQTSDPVEFTYNCLSRLPRRVGHLRGRRSGSDWDVSWTRLDEAIPQTWATPERSNEGRYAFEAYLDGDLVDARDIDQPRIQLPWDLANLFRVRQMNENGPGPWASILR